MFESLSENSQQFNYQRAPPRKASAYDADSGRLPSQVIPNPKGNVESAQAITNRSGKELGDGEKEIEVEKEPKEKEDAPQPAAEISPKVSPRKKTLKEKDKPDEGSDRGPRDLWA
ncbi:hypothetical protein ACOSQ4_004742 [Xanthoceras sorbifolium]